MGTLQLSPAKGTQLLGADLRSCYRGDVHSSGQRHGHGVYTFPNSFFTFEGSYVHGAKHGARVGGRSRQPACTAPSCCTGVMLLAQGTGG